MDTKSIVSSRRLPRNQSIVPNHYDVRLTTDLDSGQFCGSVKIDLFVEFEDQTSIKLDASNLSIDLSSISLICLSNSKTIRSCSIYHDRSDILEINLDNNEKLLRNNSYRIEIAAFSGYLNLESQVGFYRSSVDTIGSNQSGLYQISLVKKHYGLTQMSPTHCRRVFPCFDEPSLRATFDLTLIIPRHMHALSNMPQKSVEDHFRNSATKRIRFEKTPSMPTFLLCFVIGEFDIVRAQPVHRLKENQKFIETSIFFFVSSFD